MLNSPNICKSIDKCLCCDNDIELILDLGNQPPANSYLNSITDNEESYPLKLNYCNNCTHLQLSHAVNPDILFRNYLYVSGTTTTLKKYFEYFVDLVEKYSHKPKLKVLDIACNDGSQLDAFQNNGHLTFGIDPARNLYELSSQKHTVVCDYLNEQSISSFNEKFDIIVAQNVFAHNSYPKQFLDICQKYLSDDGYIFIQTSQADMIKYGQFDTIYHEHISFFNNNSMKILVESCSLYLNETLKTDIHGNSYVFIISKNNIQNNYYENKITKNMVQIFANNVKATIDSLNDQISNAKEYYTVVGYGAAAKGNTILNYGKIKLDYIVDDNKLKQGLYTPGMKIPIVSLDYINNLNKQIAWLPLSWNFFEEIKTKIISARPNTNDIFLQIKFM